MDSSNNRKPLLIEIGHEELPPSMVRRGAELFLEALTRLFTEERFHFEKPRIFATPRRTGVFFEYVSQMSGERVKEIIGPPYHISFEKDNKPTQVLLRFLEKNNISIENIEIRETEKGRYVFGKLIVPGISLQEVLARDLERILIDLPYEKKMRWTENPNLKFPRPISWVLILYGVEILPIKVFNITASNKTFGNRVFGKRELVVKDPLEYEKLLQENFVIPSPDKRKEILINILRKEAEKLGGLVVEDEELLEEVNNLVEYPHVLAGSFSKDFLELPKEVVITAMKQHQRYFSVREKHSDKLMPFFLVVVNNPLSQKEVVIKNFERVLNARLNDAYFYYKWDTRLPFGERVNLLKEISWFQNLGSVYDKIERVERILRHLCKKIFCGNTDALYRAVKLYKCDLTTEMIKDGKEFTKLEGIIGMYYARETGEDPYVAEIIGESFLPRFPGDRLPRLREAIILGIADRFDTIIELIRSGYEVKGAYDPLGLKRITLGFIELIRNLDSNVDLKDLFTNSVNEEQKSIFYEFIFSRLSAYLEEKENIRYDIVEAVISKRETKIQDVILKSIALNELLKENPQIFEKLVIGAKRLNNILRQNIEKQPNRNLMEKEEEFLLLEKGEKIKPKFFNLLEQRDYKECLMALVDLRPYIDKFFDNVFVMTDNLEVRENRLALVKFIYSLYDAYADFSKIVVETE